MHGVNISEAKGACTCVHQRTDVNTREQGNLPRKEGNSTASNDSSDFCYNHRHIVEPEILRYALYMCIRTYVREYLQYTYACTRMQ